MNAVQTTYSFVLVTAMVGGLAACSPKPEKARYTVEQYLANPDVMNATLKECADNPGDLGNDPDCVNVRAAAERQGVGSLRDLPPMGLTSPTKGEGADQSESSPQGTEHQD